MVLYGFAIEFSRFSMEFLWIFHGFLRMFYGFCVCRSFLPIFHGLSMGLICMFYGLSQRSRWFSTHFLRFSQVFSGGFLGILYGFSSSLARFSLGFPVSSLLVSGHPFPQVETLGNTKPRSFWVSFFEVDLSSIVFEVFFF